MIEILRSTDPVTLAIARGLLEGEGIAAWELDTNMSVLEGSIGILPRRITVARRDAFRARAVLADNELDGIVPAHS
ncbi:MAG: putative signal transducing protein [Paracoccaceae bacterium]